MAWLFRNRRWSSALLFGLALASKQTAWFFLPFYAILLFRQYSLKEVLYRMTIASGVFLVFNLPFILWNPHAWLSGMLTPLDSYMFPMGVGIIDFSITHMLPYFNQPVYTVLEAIAMLGSLVYYWRICHKHPEAALLLAVIPLFLAWRSLPSYFYCAAFPIYLLMAARTVSSSKLSKVTTTHDILEQTTSVAIEVPVAAQVAMQLSNM